MTISILLICIALQRLALFDRFAYELIFRFKAYFSWAIPQLEKFFKEHTWLIIVAVIVPILIITGFIFALAYFVGLLVYYVLALVLFWFCFDGRDLTKKPYPLASVSQLFTLTYQRLFAVIFWFVIFGPIGLMLYTVTISLYEFFSVEEKPLLLLTAAKLRGVLDWIPIRLLGLSYALMGNFARVIKLWLFELWSGIRTTQLQVAEWGTAALVDDIELSREDTIYLIDRTLLLWLVTIGLITIAFWLG